MDNDAKEKMENRFSYLKEKSTEELINLSDELEKDLEALWKNYNSLGSEQQNDIWNDIKYDNEQKGYIDNLLVERSDNKTR